MTSETSVKGDIAELSFAVEAKKQGLHVSFPTGGDCPYDLIIDAGGDNNLYRVQIKSSTKIEKGGTGYKINATFGTAKRKIYTRDECDMLVVHVAPLEKFYMIPIDEVISQTIRVYPSSEGTKGQYEDRLEEWSKFKGDRT